MRNAGAIVSRQIARCDCLTTSRQKKPACFVYLSLLTGAPRYLQVEESESERIQALMAFAAGCCSSERNQVGTISGKLTAVQFFHRREAGLELPVSSSLIKRALQGMANSYVLSSTPASGSPFLFVGRSVRWWVFDLSLIHI